MTTAKYLLITVVSISSMFPLLSKASTIANLTPGIIGVNESVYEKLLNSHCYLEEEDAPYDATLTPLGRLCDPLLVELEGKIILRAQHAGEMYWINTADGLPIVNRYLPDGFYKVKKRYYWMANGFKQKLSSKNIYSAFFEAAAAGDSRVTPASDLDIQALACLDYGEGSTCNNIISGHEELYENLQQRLVGRVIMAAESDGKLYFIPDIDEIDGLTHMSNDQLFTYIQNHSVAANKKIMREIPRPF